MAHVITFPGRAPVAAPPAEPVPPGPKPKAPCPICGSNVDWDGCASCARCHAVMHEVCYYGRVASLDEWLDRVSALGGLRRGPKGAPSPDALCSACPAEGA